MVKTRMMKRFLSDSNVRGKSEGNINYSALAAEAGAFSTFYTFLSSSLSVWLHVVILVLALYHTGTWIALTPKVMVLWRGDERVDPGVIAGANSILFLMISGAVIWLVLM